MNLSTTRVVKRGADQDEGTGPASESDSEDEDEFVVDRIIAQSISNNEEKGEDMYLVRWEGYSDEECTWEPLDSFKSTETVAQWRQDRSDSRILSQNEVDAIVVKMNVHAKAKAVAERVQKQQLSRKQHNISTSTATTLTSRDVASALHEPLGSVGSRKFVPPRSNAAVRNPIVNSRAPHIQRPEDLNKKTFQGTGIKPRAHRSTHHPTQSKGVSGTYFKTLQGLYRYQKAGRNEPAPDLGKLKLRSTDDFVALSSEDTAHILPTGDTRPLASHSVEIWQAGNSNIGLMTHVDPGQQPSIISTLKTAYQMDSSKDRSLTQPQRRRRVEQSYAPMTAVQDHPGYRSSIRNGRFWYTGEVVLHILFGEVPLGDVRLGGLHPDYFKSLLSLKSGHEIVINLHRQDAVTKEEYQRLCTGRSNNNLSNAWVVPYADTQSAVEELADYLHKCHSAALWFHPTQPLVLIAYAAASGHWRFLDEGQFFPEGLALRVVMRNSMPGPESLMVAGALASRPGSPARTMTIFQNEPSMLITPGSKSLSTTSFSGDVNTSDIEDSQIPKDSVAEPEVTSETASSTHHDATHDTLYQARTDGPIRSARTYQLQRNDLMTFDGVLLASTIDGNSDGPADSDSASFLTDSEQHHTPFAISAEETDRIDHTFQVRFKITYKGLTRLNLPQAAQKATMDPKKARFYLSFPSSCQIEMQAMHSMISRHTMPKLICTDEEIDGWDSFRTILGDKNDHIGVVLFHPQCAGFVGLEGLATLLRLENVNIFKVSLAQELPYCELPCHIERLFPTGTAVLITESVMAFESSNAASIVRWFAQMAKIKKGTYKLVLRPNIRQWLRRNARLNEALRANFLDMLAEVTELCSGQIATYQSSNDDEHEAESLDDCDHESGRPTMLVSPSSLQAYEAGPEAAGDPAKNEAALVAWFAGWAVQRSHKHRRFAVISSDSTYRQDWKKWGHIDFFNSTKYMQQNKIISTKVHPKDLSAVSPSS